MNRPRPLTALTHELLADVIQPGELAIDATVGNGHDTLFLAQQVGADGQVQGFDIQQTALDSARQRLQEAGAATQVQLHLQGHQHMQQRVPGDWAGKVAAITFNLGYLPGSDKQAITCAEHTLAALDQSLALLRVGGVLSILAYRGHSGGQQEADAVTAWCERHADQLDHRVHESPGPVLHYCVKR